MNVHVHARWARGLTVAVLAYATLSGCSKEKKESPADVTPSAAAPTPAATPATTPATPSAASTVGVADIVVGKAVKSGRVTVKTDKFKPADTVYASVHTTGSAPAATVMARWTFEDGQVVQESSQSIAPNGDAYTEFHIAKPTGFPKGKYKVEIFLDSRSFGIKQFEVD